MNIQIFGKSKCFETKKAERYFKERKIKYQLIDLPRFGISKGEFNAVKAAVGLRALIDLQAKDYDKSFIGYLSGEDNITAKLFENPSLFQTPIVRNGKKATVGYCPEVWKDWE